ncbi:MAG: pyridoxal phosphate-dependent aminotransferase [Candidatus Zixiibacteriota bacterium]
MNTAQRLQGMRPSPVRMLSEGAPADAISLGLGEPTWRMPKEAEEALREFSGVCGYGHNQGLPELRKALGDYYGTDAEHVLVTAGSQGALYALLNAWIGPGDKVLMPDPGFVAYPGITQLTGGTEVRYKLNPLDRFRLDSTAILPLLEDPLVKAVIINHPGNPTGAGCAEAEIRAVAAACEKRGVLLISDEVYRELYYGQRPVSLRDVSSYGVVTSSLSKAWGSPGLRVGWAIGDSSWIQPARTMHSFMVTGASVPAQRAAIKLLASSPKIHAEARAELLPRWEALQKAFKEFAGMHVEMPDGAFYHWIELPKSGHADPLAFCLKLRDEAKVITVPGFLFGEGGRKHVRLSFAASAEQVREGIKRLAPYWQEK